MAFESINELDQFSFEDCQIVDIKKMNKDLVITVEGLIVRARNSQNSNYTESYSDVTTIVFRNANVDAIYIEGYKHYDASDNLIEEKPDTPVDEKDYDVTLKNMVTGYMFNAEYIKKTDSDYSYSFEIDMDTVNDYGLTDPYCTTYQLDVTFSEVRVSWERYLNRVQK